ncbi:hypothetical protein ACH4ZX_02495 [Streptomyces sp. NPDC020490]|uniref:hypothetical protein n=1 Tax=Streptomyces sp. NPDC020490 TaxID=3365078 RepID=UPI0037B12B24
MNSKALAEQPREVPTRAPPPPAHTGGWSPAPGVGKGIAYAVSAGSTADGGGGDEATCWQ